MQVQLDPRPRRQVAPARRPPAPSVRREPQQPPARPHETRRDARELGDALEVLLRPAEQERAGAQAVGAPAPPARPADEGHAVQVLLEPEAHHHAEQQRGVVEQVHPAAGVEHQRPRGHQPELPREVPAHADEILREPRRHAQERAQVDVQESVTAAWARAQRDMERPQDRGQSGGEVQAAVRVSHGRSHVCLATNLRVRSIEGPPSVREIRDKR